MMTVDEKQVLEDWQILIDKINTQVEFPYIDTLKEIPVHCVDDLNPDSIDSVAEISFDKNGLCLNISEIFFLLKGSYAVMALLHELCHALIIVKYIMENDIKGLKLYYKDNNGHNEEWESLANTMNEIFPKIPKIEATLNLDNDDYYEDTLCD